MVKNKEISKNIEVFKSNDVANNDFPHIPIFVNIFIKPQPQLRAISNYIVLNVSSSTDSLSVSWPDVAPSFEILAFCRIMKFRKAKITLEYNSSTILNMPNKINIFKPKIHAIFESHMETINCLIYKFVIYLKWVVLYTFYSTF